MVPWIWTSAFVGVIAGLASPLLILLAYGVCRQPEDPTGRILIAPAHFLIQLLDLDSMLSISVAVGLSYGLPILALGAVITGLRRAWSR